MRRQMDTGMWRVTRGRLVQMLVLTVLGGLSAAWGAQDRGPDGRAHNPGVTGWCDTPAADRKAELGCYTTAINPIGSLPAGPLFWHLDTFPTREAAEASRGPRDTVVGTGCSRLPKRNGVQSPGSMRRPEQPWLQEGIS